MYRVDSVTRLTTVGGVTVSTRVNLVLSNEPKYGTSTFAAYMDATCFDEQARDLALTSELARVLDLDEAASAALSQACSAALSSVFFS